MRLRGVFVDPDLTPLARAAIVFYMNTTQTTTGYYYTDEERAAMQAALRWTIFTYKTTDKYGRRVTESKVGNRTVTSITAMPKAHRDAGNGTHYVTDWTTDYNDPNSRGGMFFSLKAARAHADRILADAVAAAKADAPIGTIN